VALVSRARRGPRPTSVDGRTRPAPLHRPGRAHARPHMRVPRRRFGVVLLVAGLAVAAIPLIEATPDDRNFVVRIGDPEQVERVEILWTDEGAPLRQASLSFEVGSAPERVERSIPL